MKEFDLKRSIKDWKKQLYRHQGLEPEYIDELEANLLDRIDEYMAGGDSEQTAFNKAVERFMPEPETLADEYYKARTNSGKTPPWRRRNSLISKAPLHIKIAYRNLTKRRVYSLLNLIGLGVSMAISLLIWLYVQDQSSYDQHYENADRIYRVIYDVTSNAGVRIPQADVGQPVGPTLKADFPEVIEFTRTRRIGATNTLASKDLSIESEDFFVTDPNFFKVFSIDLIGGDPLTALVEPNTVVITEELAMRLLGRTDVVGEVLTYSGLRPPMDIKISGVMENLNSHTHLQVQALISYATYMDDRERINWLRKSYTYVLLDEQNNIESVRSKIPDFNKKYLEEVFQRRAQSTANLLFQPLTSIYLDDDYLGEPYPHGSREDLRILKIIMAFLLVMACINYVNLATARAVDRAVEVGIRKTLGSSRKLLVIQFITEAILLAVTAGLLAIIIAIPLIPYYNTLSGLEFSINEVVRFENMFLMLVISIAIGVLAGIYPAFYMSRFRPNAILKGKFSTSKRGVLLRKSLIISQYSIASVLIIWMTVVGSQISYMKNREVGFDKEGILQITIPDDRSVLDRMEAFMQQVNNLPGVRSSSKTKEGLTGGYAPGGQLMEDPDGERVTTHMAAYSVSYDFIKTIDASFVSGHDFDRLRPDERAILINQTASKLYGWDDREFQVKYLGRDRQGNVTSKWKVIGVVSDFTFGPAHREGGPMIFFLDSRTIPESNLLIGTETDPFQLVPAIANIWESHFGDYPMEFKSIEDELNALYAREETFLNLLSALGGVIALITALGIIGLISFTAELRKKEIALRKICGAQIKAILLLLSKQFVLLLVLSMLIAIPLGYYISDHWLTDFTLHIKLDIWILIVAFPVCIIFTMLSVMYHGLRAARSNPVDALRYE